METEHNRKREVIKLLLSALVLILQDLHDLMQILLLESDECEEIAIIKCFINPNVYLVLGTMYKKL